MIIIVEDTDGEVTRFPSDWNGAVIRAKQPPKMMEASKWRAGDIVQCLHPNKKPMCPIKFQIEYISSLEPT